MHRANKKKQRLWRQIERFVVQEAELTAEFAVQPRDCGKRMELGTQYEVSKREDYSKSDRWRLPER